VFDWHLDTPVSHAERSIEKELCETRTKVHPSPAQSILESPVSRSKKKAVRPKPVCPRKVSTRSSAAEMELASRDKGVATRSIIAKLKNIGK
jgi:hypothetical protein